MCFTYQLGQSDFSYVNFLNVPSPFIVLGWGSHIQSSFFTFTNFPHITSRFSVLNFPRLSLFKTTRSCENSTDSGFSFLPQVIHICYLYNFLTKSCIILSYNYNHQHFTEKNQNLPQTMCHFLNAIAVFFFLILLDIFILLAT